MYNRADLSRSEVEKKKSKIFDKFFKMKPDFLTYDLVGEKNKWNNARVAITSTYGTDFSEFERALACVTKFKPEKEIAEFLNILNEQIKKNYKSSLLLDRVCEGKLIKEKMRGSAMKTREIDPVFLKSTLDIKDFLSIKDLFKRSEGVDIAQALSELSIMDCIVLFRIVSKTRKSDVFYHLSFERQIQLIENLPDVLVTILLNEMEPDDRTHLLEPLPEELKNKLLLRLSPEQRNVAWRLLSYPEDSVGRLMTPDFMILKDFMTANQSLDYIRWSSELPSEYLNYLFIVDENRRLCGEITLADLVKSDPPTAIVSDIMSYNYIFLEPHVSQEAALEMFKRYDRLVVPVVDGERRVIGIVTADDMFDVAEEEATEDIQQFGGQGALENSYFQTPLGVMIRKRAGWLCLLF